MARGDSSSLSPCALSFPNSPHAFFDSRWGDVVSGEPPFLMPCIVDGFFLSGHSHEEFLVLEKGGHFLL